MEKEKRLNYFDIIVYAMMIVAVGYIIVQTLLGNNNELSFKITLGIWIVAAVVVGDFIEPYVGKVFDDISFKKGLYYIIFAVTDAAAYMCFYVFIINIGFTKEILHYVFLGLALVFLMGKILFKRMYENVELTESATSVKTDSLDSDDFEVNTLDNFRTDNSVESYINNKEDDEDVKVMIYRKRNK